MEGDGKHPVLYQPKKPGANRVKELDKNSWDYFSEVFVLVKVILVVPATNALSEHSCSALRRLKTYLRTTMCQNRLNHCMILYVDKDVTDALEITDIGNQFVANCKDQTQLSRFGRFKSQVSSWYQKDHIWTFIVVNIC